VVAFEVDEEAEVTLVVEAEVTLVVEVVEAAVALLNLKNKNGRSIYPLRSSTRRTFLCFSGSVLKKSSEDLKLVTHSPLTKMRSLHSSLEINWMN
jgi:hypothetical protein